jgi:hypothetical protein
MYSNIRYIVVCGKCSKPGFYCEKCYGKIIFNKETVARIKEILSQKILRDFYYRK